MNVSQVRFLFRLLIVSFWSVAAFAVLSFGMMHFVPLLSAIAFWAFLLASVSYVIILGLLARAMNRREVIWVAVALCLGPLGGVLTFMRMYEIAGGFLQERKPGPIGR